MPDMKPAAEQQVESDKTDSNQPIVSRYPYLFRIGHWLLVITIPLLFITGLSLHAVVRASSPGPGNHLPGWMMPGRVYLLHMFVALIFAPAVIAALVGCIQQPTARRFWRRSTLSFLLLGSLLLVITGYQLLHISGVGGTYLFARNIHSVLGMWLVPLAFLVHLVQGLAGKHRKLLVPAFHPMKHATARQIGTFVMLAVITTCLLLNGGPLQSPMRRLTAGKIADDTIQQVGGDMAKLPWDDSTQTVVPLANGAGFGNGCTAVHLQSRYDSENIYIYARWSDPQEDRQYMPWKKTDDGWQRMVSDSHDENVYYEDKFSLVFPIGDDPMFEQFSCAEYCHIGGTNAYGYKTADRPVDVWHWKASRTDPVNQFDDKYWSEPDFEKPTFGRFGDPKDSGGYKINESEETPDVPAWLPTDLAKMRQGIIPTEDAVPYSDELAAQIATDELIAGLVAEPFVGDRGDVDCQSSYADGHWNLYIRRELDTGSEYDRVFTPGELIPFGCAAFDRSSKRHAYELTTYWLKLQSDSE